MTISIAILNLSLAWMTIAFFLAIVTGSDLQKNQRDQLFSSLIRSVLAVIGALFGVNIVPFFCFVFSLRRIAIV